MLTEAQREQRRNAGKASYRKLCRTLLEENTWGGEIHWDRFAERLSCIRWNRGFKKKTGLTSEYCREWCEREGLLEAYTIRMEFDA